MSKGLALIQEGLRSLGYDPGPVDGLYGPKTARALMEAGVNAFEPKGANMNDLPWLVEGRKVIGLHETRDNAKLRAWLKSDGKTLGDPDALPWCGDYVETCIKLALPGEPLPGRVGENPYFARNWAAFGLQTAPTYGAVLVFERGPNSGHVGFCVGQSTDGKAFLVLGGNQSDTVSVVPIAKSRLIASRWPATFPARPIDLPRKSVTQALSTNEA
jgi:uncharacterized protein (TIGR02594 family)